MVVYKLDLHNHTSTFPKVLGKRQNPKLYVETILKNIFKQKGNLVLGIADFHEDKRYDTFLAGMKQLPYQLDLRHQNSFFSLHQGKRSIIFLRTKEVETDKGHFLLIGFLGKTKGRNLKDLLKEAKKQHAIVIANHTLHQFPISQFLVLRSMRRDTEHMSANAITLERYKKYFEALELNPYFPKDWKNIRNIANKEKIALVTDSDAHFPEEFFRSYILLEDLHFSSLYAFQKSFRRALKKGLKLHARKAGYISLYKHAFQILFWFLVVRLGIIKP